MNGRTAWIAGAALAVLALAWLGVVLYFCFTYDGSTPLEPVSPLP